MKIFTTLLASVLFLALIPCAHAQYSASYIDINNTRAPIKADGYFFNNTTQTNGFEAPAGSGKICIYASNLWMGGMDQNGILHVAAQTYQQNGTDYWPAPLTTSGAANLPTAWDKIWTITRAQIDDHIANYNQASYAIPSNISDWPGSTYNGVSQIFAPFVDVNSNGVYDPTYGDYPNVAGDKALYLMYNDMYSNHGESGGLQLDVEVYTTVYAYHTTTSDALNNTVFVRHRIRNRSQNTYSNMFVGIWNDFDIGDYNDDYVGTDVPRNMVYGYNADSLDGDGTGVTYGNHLPWAALKILNHPLSSGMYYENSSSANVGNPTSPYHYYNYLQAKWKDGSDLSFGSNGYQTGQGNTKFAFSNGTDTNFTTNWQVPSQADFRIMANTGDYTLMQTGYITIDAAYIFAQPLNNEGISLLNNYADEVQTFYNNIINGEEEIVTQKLNLVCYPNPANQILTICSNLFLRENFNLQVIDIAGKIIDVPLIRNGNNSVAIDVSAFAKGMYIIQGSNQNEILHTKFVVE